jgi:hypothetical protein
MKKIFLMFVAVCALFACDPTHEKISNDGHITIDELKAKTTVTVDKAASGLNGNVISCQTLAPVNAKWTIGGKDFIANYAQKKMKVGTHDVVLTALCADGTVLSTTYQVECQEITDPLVKYYIYGADPERSRHSPQVLGMLQLCVSALLRVLTCPLFPMMFTSA